MLPSWMHFGNRHRASTHAGWSVLPLNWHDVAEVTLRRLSRGAGLAAAKAEPPSPVLHFVAEVVAPVTEEASPEAAASPDAAITSAAFNAASEEEWRPLASDGELAAFGALICILSAVATLSAMAWLMAALA
ncbi:hypothetical protein [Defluviicoccus vanus]|uniref:hypothetical protein n=1 Tax=Defluviicoccus vanus TaxID=111831 RepID=UPI001CBA66A6|nr:hypothetical protein [Defluviicoccus vanus]